MYVCMYIVEHFRFYILGGMPVHPQLFRDQQYVYTHVLEHT